MIDPNRFELIPIHFNISQWKKKTEPDDSSISLKDYVLKSSIPPAHKCPSCICPKVSVLAGVGSDAVCAPCPVQRCPAPAKIEMPKCPPQPICPTPNPQEIPAPQIKVYPQKYVPRDNGDQNTVDWLRQALEATGDKTDFIQKAIGTLLGKQLDGTGVNAVQDEVNNQVDIQPSFQPNKANSGNESFVNAPKTFTVDGQLI